MQENLIACLVAAGLSIGLFHLFPWPWGELHRVIAYFIGTGNIWFWLGIYCGWSREFWQMSLFPLVVGAVVLTLKATGQFQRWAILTAWPWTRDWLISHLSRSDDGTRSE